jgi:hypothetical protein
MIVHSGGTGKVELPDLSTVLDLSEDVGADQWMVEGGTDLLSGHRLRAMRNLFIAVIAVGAVIVGIWYLVSRLGDDEEPVAHVRQDAAIKRKYVPDEPKPDAQEISKDDIVALSKFGFFSINANQKTTIYVDNVRYGETPMQRLPLPPGPHKVKAVTKGKKPKEFMITIIGGRDTDEGTIDW